MNRPEHEIIAEFLDGLIDQAAASEREDLPQETPHAFLLRVKRERET